MATDKLIKKIALDNGDSGVFAADQNTKGETLLTAENIDENENLKQFFINLCYPVGSIYISEKSDTEFNPNSEWSGTTWHTEWEKLDSNRFLMSAYEGVDVKQVGGSDKIAVSQIPEHLHNTPYYTSKPENIDDLLTATAGGRLAVQGDGHPVYYKYIDNTTSAISLNSITTTKTRRAGYTGVDIGRVGTSGGIYMTDSNGKVVSAKSRQESYYPPYYKVVIWRRTA